MNSRALPDKVLSILTGKPSAEELKAIDRARSPSSPPQPLSSSSSGDHSHKLSRPASLSNVHSPSLRSVSPPPFQPPPPPGPPPPPLLVVGAAPPLHELGPLFSAGVAQLQQMGFNKLQAQEALKRSVRPSLSSVSYVCLLCVCSHQCVGVCLEGWGCVS